MTDSISIERTVSNKKYIRLMTTNESYIDVELSLTENDNLSVKIFGNSSVNKEDLEKLKLIPYLLLENVAGLLSYENGLITPLAVDDISLDNLTVTTRDSRDGQFKDGFNSLNAFNMCSYFTELKNLAKKGGPEIISIIPNAARFERTFLDKSHVINGTEDSYIKDGLNLLKSNYDLDRAKKLNHQNKNAPDTNKPKQVAGLKPNPNGGKVTNPNGGLRTNPDGKNLNKNIPNTNKPNPNLETGNNPNGGLRTNPDGKNLNKNIPNTNKPNPNLETGNNPNGGTNQNGGTNLNPKIAPNQNLRTNPNTGINPNPNGGTNQNGGKGTNPLTEPSTGIGTNPDGKNLNKNIPNTNKPNPNLETGNNPNGGTNQNGGTNLNPKIAPNQNLRTNPNTGINPNPNGGKETNPNGGLRTNPNDETNPNTGVNPNPNGGKETNPNGGLRTNPDGKNLNKNIPNTNKSNPILKTETNPNGGNNPNAKYNSTQNFTDNDDFKIEVSVDEQQLELFDIGDGILGGAFFRDKDKDIIATLKGTDLWMFKEMIKDASLKGNRADMETIIKNNPKFAELNESYDGKKACDGVVVGVGDDGKGKKIVHAIGLGNYDIQNEHISINLTIGRGNTKSNYSWYLPQEDLYIEKNGLLSKLDKTSPEYIKLMDKVDLPLSNNFIKQEKFGEKNINKEKTVDNSKKIIQTKVELPQDKPLEPVVQTHEVKSTNGANLKFDKDSIKKFLLTANEKDKDINFENSAKEWNELVDGFSKNNLKLDSVEALKNIILKNNNKKDNNITTDDIHSFKKSFEEIEDLEGKQKFINNALLHDIKNNLDVMQK